MRISCRDKVVVAFPQGGLNHEVNPYPTNILSPDVDADDPSKYSGISDQYYFCAQCCKPVLIKEKNKSNKKACPICHSPRVSLVSRDKGFSSRGMEPGTLNMDSGGSTNFEQGGPMYHLEPINRDTFSGNLGK